MGEVQGKKRIQRRWRPSFTCDPGAPRRPRTPPSGQGKDLVPGVNLDTDLKRPKSDGTTLPRRRAQTTAPVLGSRRPLKTLSSAFFGSLAHLGSRGPRRRCLLRQRVEGCDMAGSVDWPSREGSWKRRRFSPS